MKTRAEIISDESEHKPLLGCTPENMAISNTEEKSGCDNFETRINLGANPSVEENSSTKKYALLPVEAAILIMKHWIDLRRLSDMG